MVKELVRSNKLNSIQISSQRGFTLIELLLYMGLLTIIVGVLSTLFVSIIEVRLESKANSNVEQDGRYLIARLAYDIRRANGATPIVSPILGATSSSLQIQIDSVNYTYSIAGSNLALTNNLGTDNLNGYETTVSGLTFQRLGNSGGKNSIQVSFTLTSNTIRNSGTEVRNFQTTIATR